MQQSKSTRRLTLDLCWLKSDKQDHSGEQMRFLGEEFLLVSSVSQIDCWSAWKYNIQWTFVEAAECVPKDMVDFH